MSYSRRDFIKRLGLLGLVPFLPALPRVKKKDVQISLTDGKTTIPLNGFTIPAGFPSLSCSELESSFRRGSEAGENLRRSLVKLDEATNEAIIAMKDLGIVLNG